MDQPVGAILKSGCILANLDRFFPYCKSFGLTWKEMCLLILLDAYTDQDGIARVSYRQLCKEMCDTSRRNLHAMVKKLVDLRLLNVSQKRVGRSYVNDYDLNPFFDAFRMAPGDSCIHSDTFVQVFHFGR